MAQNECPHPRHFDRLIYTLKFTRDPLINRSVLCKNPRILQGDFQLYKYNIDVMEKNSAFSKVFNFISLHKTNICFSFFFFISDHFIQKPCYIITLCSPGELHRGPCGLHNSFDQGKYHNE
jgi:hypothetical protein